MSSTPTADHADESVRELERILADSDDVHVANGPEDIENADPAGRLHVTVPSGRFKDDRPVHVSVTLSVPPEAEDLCTSFLPKMYSPEARVALWEHFVVEPGWLLEPERHGVFPKGEPVGALSKEEREARAKKLLPGVLIDRLTQKILLASGVDGSFFEDRMRMMPPRARQQLERLSSRSQANLASRQASSHPGIHANEPNSTGTFADDASATDSRSKQTSRTSLGSHSPRKAKTRRGTH